MKKTLYTLSAIAFLAVGCGGGTNNNNSANDNANETVNTANTTEVPKEASAKPTEYPNWQTNKGIGKVKTITPPLADTPDAAMAAKGKATFNQYCMACHLPTKRLIGPAMAGLTDYRTPEWLMNMILNPEQMIKEDPIAKAQLEEYGGIMLNQHLTEQQAREVLEYLRTIK